MKRLLAVLAVAAVAVALPAAAQAKVEKSKTFIQLSDVATTDSDSSGGNSAGDIATFTLSQFNHEGGKKIGAGHGNCILNVDPFAICTTILKDAKGNSLVVMWEDSSAVPSFRFAIVGGTGKYRHARGHGKSTAVNGDPTKFIVRARVVY